MHEKNVIYLAKVRSIQTFILVIQAILMVIGGSVFGLGVLTRPILRIIRPEQLHHVTWIIEMMVFAGWAQLVTSGLDCFVACWKLIWPIYLGIGLTAMTMFLEFGAIGTSLHLMHQADQFANEDVVHPWYWVECQSLASCHEAMWSYINSYVLPQITLTAIAIFLQGLGIMNLGRLVRTIVEHSRSVHNYGEWYREHLVENANPVLTKKASVKLAPAEDQFSPGRLVAQDMSNSQCHTPSSILKSDHGYVPASGASLVDFDDTYMRSRAKVAHTQSISFNTDVQVHYYDAKEKLSEKDSEEPERDVEDNHKK